jgi:hypothetical protein
VRSVTVVKRHVHHPDFRGSFSIKAVLPALVPRMTAVRKRWLIEKFVAKSRLGALWAINTNIEDYELPGAPGYGSEVRQLLSRVRTDLNSFSDGEVACLENHGYSLADAALRSRAPQLLANPVPQFVWPHRGAGAPILRLKPLLNTVVPDVSFAIPGIGRQALSGRLIEDEAAPVRRWESGYVTDSLQGHRQHRDKCDAN